MHEPRKNTSELGLNLLAKKKKGMSEHQAWNKMQMYSPVEFIACN